MVPLSGTDSGKRFGVEAGSEWALSSSFSGVCLTTTGSSDIWISFDGKLRTKDVSFDSQYNPQGNLTRVRPLCVLLANASTFFQYRQPPKDCISLVNLFLCLSSNSLYNICIHGEHGSGT
jgi:hypothetical protein